jgi:hypothetical protein
MWMSQQAPVWREDADEKNVVESCEQKPLIGTRPLFVGSSVGSDAHYNESEKRMLIRLVTACAFVALATTAYAADTSSSNPSTTNAAANQQSAQNLPHEIQSKLQQDGFTDVKVVPGSFFVSAKDKRGDPVTMIIGPHSMLMMSEAKMGNSASPGNDGSGESGSHAK